MVVSAAKSNDISSLASSSGFFQTRRTVIDQAVFSGAFASPRALQGIAISTTHLAVVGKLGATYCLPLTFAQNFVPGGSPFPPSGLIKNDIAFEGDSKVTSRTSCTSKFCGFFGTLPNWQK